MPSSASSASAAVHTVRVRRALISVSDKSGLVPFGRALASMGVEIISTGGTARALNEAGIRTTPIDSVTGYPEMMDGRVKSLHPAIHGAVLARRDDPSHVESMKTHGIVPIDLVCVNLYPFEETVRVAGIEERAAIEQIDIGGPAMVRSAAKNHEFVAVVTSPVQYDRIVSELGTNEGATTLALRRELAAAAFDRTAAYDSAISDWMATSSDRPAEAFPAILQLRRRRVAKLRYGENPHQEAAVYGDDQWREASVLNANMRCGKPLSYNNLNDAAAALELVQELDALFAGHAAAAIIKHANPCGAAVGKDAHEAFERAYAGDPLAAFGGILAVSKGIDEMLARSIGDGERFLEVIVAPEIDDAAVRLLGERWKNVRLLAVGSVSRGDERHLTYRSVAGGMLVQESDVAVSRPSEWQHVAGPRPDDRLLDDAAFVWTIAKHLKSNAVAVGRDFQLLGGGMGQVDRVTACRLAVERAASKMTDPSSTHPVIAASDAFFPFADGPKLLIDAGVKCIVHPGGSRRDHETTALCREHNVTCLLTGVRHFRH